MFADAPSLLAQDTATQLHGSSLRVLRVLRAVRPTKGLTGSGLSVLGRLYGGGRATASELAAYLRVRPQSLTRLIAEFERRRLIVRESNSEDRRRNHMEITKEGIELLGNEVKNQRMVLAHTIEKELTHAEQEILRIAAGLVDRIAQAIEAPAPGDNARRKKA
jgi:DNA-binding MarR family transcriptional regulator